MLKQLRLQINLEAGKKRYAALLDQKRGFDERQADIEKRFAAATEKGEDLAPIEADLKTLEDDIAAADVDAKIVDVEAEITRIENELKETGEGHGAAGASGNDNENEKRGKNTMNKYQVRRMLESGEYYERAEVKDFYEKLKNIRAVSGEGLTVPEIIVNRIMDIMGDYTTLYPLVDKIRAKGTARILIDTDTTAATWLESKGTLPTGDVGTITDISFDGYKVGKVTFVDNAMMQDSIVNLDDYVTKKLARAIALALDLAILNGEGDAQKEPTGIITALDESHKVTVTDPTSVAAIVKPIALVDDGTDSTGDIVAVMKRSTYYNRLLEFSIATTDAGEVVGKLPNIKKPDLLGLDVVFNNGMDVDKILYGDMTCYTLVERESITIDKSEHVKFAEDQTAFRGKGRYDGKPTKKNAFVLVTLVFTAEAAAASTGEDDETV